MIAASPPRWSTSADPLPGARTRLTVVLAVWSFAALIFALWRVPFDDEWFSIELALNTNWSEFVSALRQDVHMPWVALLDRAVGALAGRPAITLVHVASSAAAIGLIAITVERRSGIPGWLVALVGFHPMLMLYGGSARWYPILLLAQALRMHGVWCERPNHFAAGALIGSLVSVVDLPFLLHDAVWLLILTPRGRRQSKLALLAGCLLLPLLSFVTTRSLWAIGIGAGTALSLSVSAIARMVVAGSSGEGHLDLPLCVIALAVPLAAVAGWWSLAKRRVALALWLALVVCGWLLATLKGVWHPRYALMLTVVVWIALVALARAGRVGRVLGTLAAGYLLIGLALTVAGKGMIKKDLNELSAAECKALLPPGRLDTVVAMSPEIGARLTKCSPHTPVVVIDKLPTYLAERDAAGTVLPQLSAAEHIVVVGWLSRRRDRLSAVAEQLRERLQPRCRALPIRHVVGTAHYALKRRLDPATPPHRFYREPWQCDAAVPRGGTLAEK